VRPSYWSAGYFTLAPNQSTTVSVSVPVSMLHKQTPAITVEAWNVEKQVVELK